MSLTAAIVSSSTAHLDEAEAFIVFVSFIPRASDTGSTEKPVASFTVSPTDGAMAISPDVVSQLPLKYVGFNVNANSTAPVPAFLPVTVAIEPFIVAAAIVASGDTVAVMPPERFADGSVLPDGMVLSVTVLLAPFATAIAARSGIQETTILFALSNETTSELVLLLAS